MPTEDLCEYIENRERENSLAQNAINAKFIKPKKKVGELNIEEALKFNSKKKF